MVGLPWVKPLPGAVGVASSPRPSASRPLSGPSSLAKGLWPELGSDVPPGGGCFAGHEFLWWCPLPVFEAGALESAPGRGPGGLSPAARLCVLSSKPRRRQALPAKVSRTFRRAGSKVASLLLSLLLTSVHRKPSWVPFIPRMSAQAEAAQNLSPLASPW